MFLSCVLPVHGYVDLSVIGAFWMVLPLGFLGYDRMIGKMEAKFRSVDVLKVGQAFIFLLCWVVFT